MLGYVFILLVPQFSDPLTNPHSTQISTVIFKSAQPASKTVLFSSFLVLKIWFQIIATAMRDGICKFCYPTLHFYVGV